MNQKRHVRTACYALGISLVLSLGCRSHKPKPHPGANIPVPPVPPTQVAAHVPNVDKELMIRDLKVVNSTRATDSQRKWHIRTLLSNMSQNGGDPSAFTLHWLRTWETAQTINNSTVA